MPQDTMAREIERLLREQFAPVHLELVNESHQHNVPPGSETHFKLTLVDAAFASQRLVARHQSVYAALAGPLSSGVHALALHTYSPDEWTARSGAAPKSPPCLGGSAANG